MTWPPETKAARAAWARGGVTKPKRKTPELDLQTTVAEFLRLAVQRPARWWFCPNGGNLSKVQRARFQKAGLTPGVPDLHFGWTTDDGAGWCVGDEPGPRFGTIEMKAGRGKLSPDQEDFRDDMRALGHYWAECRSLEEVVSTLKSWGFPLRADL